MTINTSIPSAALSRRAVLAGAAASTVLLSPTVNPKAATVIKGTVIGKEGWLFLIWDNPSKANPEVMRSVTSVIGDTVKILKAANIGTVIALTPTKARVYREYLPDDFQFSSDADRRYATAVEDLRRAGALVPDLAASFSDLRKNQPNEKLFFQADTHWTAFGADRAAGEVAKLITDKLHLPPSSKPGSRLGGTVEQVHYNSDLSQVLPLPERTSYPPENYQVREVLAAQGSSSLTDEDTSDVIVVGNSYMQPKYEFAPVLSSKLNRPVMLVWKIHLVGPYKTMLDYLASDSFRHKRPKAIVWNFHEIDMEITLDSEAAWPQDAMTNDAFLTAVQRAVRL